MKKIATVVLICMFMLSTIPMPIQAQVKKEIKPVSSEKLESELLSKKFDDLDKKDKKLMKLNEHLTKKGYKAQKQKNNYWGMKEKYQDVDGKTATFFVYLQDYFKPNSKDGAARGQVVVETADKTETYTFFLEAPEGKYDKAVEFMVDDNLSIVKANSWWSCVQNQLVNACAQACVTALVGCAVAAAVTGPFSWATFLACVAAACGTCYALQTACCGCNCGWCKVLVGCCRM